MMLMTGVILVAKPNKLFQLSHLRTESNENLTKYFTGLCLALIAAFCGALIGITTKVLKGKQSHFTVGFLTKIYFGISKSCSITQPLCGLES